MNKLTTFFTCLFCLAATTVQAQEAPVEIERPVLSAYTFEAGSAHLAETYLSPLKYSGWALGLGYERMQAMRFNPEKWVMQLNFRLRGEGTQNTVGNADMWNLGLEMRWGMQRVFRLDGGWKVFAGGSTGLDAGVIYNPRNSNNPVAVKAAWTVGALGAVAYNGTWRKIPFCLRYQLNVPLTGVFFSPAYGELYYEIYMGNHKGLARAAWFGNYFRMDNLLTLDMRFGRTTLRLGYRLDALSQEASHIVTRRVSHTAVIGVVNEWISLGVKPSLSKKTKIINALY